MSWKTAPVTFHGREIGTAVLSGPEKNIVDITIDDKIVGAYLNQNLVGSYSISIVPPDELNSTQVQEN